MRRMVGGHSRTLAQVSDYPPDVSEVRRMLRAFHLEPDEGLAGEWVVEGLSLADLQRLFGLANGDPMYDSYRVTEAQAEPLSRATGTKIDLQRYEYFMDADALY